MVEQVNRAAFHTAEPTRWLVPPLVLNGRFLTQPVTGVQRVARALLKEFDELVDDGRLSAPRIVVPRRSDLNDPPKLKALEIERAGVLTGHAWEQFELPAIAGSDVLLCLGNTAPVARLKRERHQTVVMVHDLSYLYFPKAYDWRFRFLYNSVVPTVLRHSTHLITVSNAEKAAIQRTYPATKSHPSFHVLQNGGASTPAGESLGSREPLGLYVGSLSQRKNAKGVLRVAIDFLRANRFARFQIIGGTAASLNALDLDVPEDVAPRLLLSGQINDAKQIEMAYQKARFLLFPSFYEASPLPPIEAMQNGCPVICSTIPSLRERCGEAALYRAPADYPGMLEDAQALLTNDRFWNECSSRSRAHAMQFTWRAQALALLSILEPTP